MSQGRVSDSSALTIRIVAPNPGPTTLQGTNTYVIRAPGARRTIVVDPGPADEAHLARVLAHGPVDQILLTHRHPDHADAAVLLARRTGAAVRAWDAASCLNGPRLRDREVVRGIGIELEVLHAPGHSADSVVFRLPDDGPVGKPPQGSVLTGDTILGRGTPVLAESDGSMADYLSTLERLSRLGAGVIGLTGHGPVLPDLAETAQAYRHHREERLREVQDALRKLGLPPSVAPRTVAAVVERVYANVPPDFRVAASASVRAQLAYLQR